MPTDRPPSGFLAGRIKRGRYLFLNMKPQTDKIAIVCAGWEECHPDFAIVRPNFPYEAVELLAGGQWEVRLGGKWRRSDPGTIVVYGPRARCSIRATGNGPHFKYFVDLTGRKSAELIEDCGLSGRRTLPGGESARIAQLLEQILSCGELRGAGRSAAACALLVAALRRVAACRATPRHHGSRGSETFERCRIYVESHYPSIESISSAATACHVTAPYFSRLFRRHTGATAEHFLNSLRMNHAARLLQQAHVTVKEAGMKVGFKDPYHFSRAFKRVHGKAPRDFAR